MKTLRKLPYWYLLVIPILIFCLGAASNTAVLIANGGKFPVMLSEGAYYQYCTATSEEEGATAPPISCMRGGQMIDPVHSVMGPNSHLKALADIIPVGKAVYSVGDGLLELGDFLLGYLPIAWAALVIRKLLVS